MNKGAKPSICKHFSIKEDEKGGERGKGKFFKSKKEEDN